MKKAKFLYTILLMVILPNLNLIAQTDTIPLSLTKKYFSGDLKNYKTYFAFESIDHDFDPRKIQKKAVIHYETIFNSGKKAVIAVSIEEKNQASDAYVFWINVGEWKLQAVKTLWLPAMYNILVEQYKDLDEQGIKLKYEEIIKKNLEEDSILSRDMVIGQIGSLADFTANIRSLQLTISPDKELIEHFERQKEKFNALLKEVNSNFADKGTKLRLDIKSDYKIRMQEILITVISNPDNENNIQFIIGGMNKNLVGYLYCKDYSNLPQMDSKGFILIKSLGNGWYLFKTT